MRQITALIVIVLLCGCTDPSSEGPMLKLTIKRDNGSSVGRYRVTHTGTISDSGDGGGEGQSTGEAITIDKIADEGVTVTVTIVDSEDGGSRKQFLVPYDKVITTEIAEKATVIAQLEREE